MSSSASLHDTVERDVSAALFAALAAVTEGLVREAVGTPMVQEALRALVAVRIDQMIAELSGSEPAKKKGR